MMKNYITKKSILILLILLFLGNILFSLYRNFHVIPENLWNLIKKSNNYVIIYGDYFNDLKDFPPPLQKEKILKDGLLIQMYQYPIESIPWDFILSLNPKELKIHYDKDTINLYFYKKLFYFDSILEILYNSFLWTISITIMTGFLGFLLFFSLYLLIRLRKFLKEYLTKKIYYVKEMN